MPMSSMPASTMPAKVPLPTPPYAWPVRCGSGGAARVVWTGAVRGGVCGWTGAARCLRCGLAPVRAVRTGAQRREQAGAGSVVRRGSGTMWAAQGEGDSMLVAPGLEITELPDTWGQEQRPEVLRTFESQIYGRVPDPEVGLDWSVLEEGRTEDGRRRRQLAVRFTGPHGVAKVLLLVYLPAPAGNRGPDREGAGAERGTSPAFLGVNFQGKHACTTDPGVIQVGTDLPESETGSVYYDQHASYPVPPPRGNNAAAWPFHLANERGYAVITAHYLQTGPDHQDMFHQGLLPIFGERSEERRVGKDIGAQSRGGETL